MSIDDPNVYWLIFHGIAGRTVVLKQGIRAADDAAREASDRGQVVEVRNVDQEPMSLNQLLMRLQGLD